MVWGYNGFRVLWFGVIAVQGLMVWGYSGFRVLWFGVITGTGLHITWFAVYYYGLG